MFGRDPRHVGPVVRDGRRDLHVRIEDRLILPVDNGHPTDGRRQAVGSDPHHFAVQGKVNVALGHGSVVVFLITAAARTRRGVAVEGTRTVRGSRGGRVGGPLLAW